MGRGLAIMNELIELNEVLGILANDEPFAKTLKDILNLPRFQIVNGNLKCNEEIVWDDDNSLFENNLNEDNDLTTKWVWNDDAIDWNLGCWQCKECGCINTMLSSAKDINPMIYQASKYCPSCGRKVIGYESLQS